VVCLYVCMGGVFERVCMCVVCLYVCMCVYVGYV